MGASIIYASITRKILREFPNDSSLQKPSSIPHPPEERSRMINRFVSASDGLGACMACEQRDVASDRALHELSKSLHEEKLQIALQESDGLCFPHLAQLLERIQEPDDMNFLLNLTRDKLETRQSEMAELIRKNDYRFRSVGITWEEAIAWKKAMCMISGASITLTGEKHE